jgi:hypothetical protein
MDLHKKESQICLLTETGEVMERRIRTEPRRFAVRRMMSFVQMHDSFTSLSSTRKLGAPSGRIPRASRRDGPATVLRSTKHHITS